MAPSQRAATATGSKLAPLPYAGLQLRIVAFILDILVLISFGMLFAAGAIAFLVIESDSGNPSSAAFLITVGVLLLYVFAFVPLYHVLLWSWRGQTVGKMAVRIKVQSRNGGPLSLGQSALRFLGYVVSALPIFLGLVIALFDRERRALHDILAGTVVVELP